MQTMLVMLTTKDLPVGMLNSDKQKTQKAAKKTATHTDKNRTQIWGSQMMLTLDASYSYKSEFLCLYMFV